MGARSSPRPARREAILAARRDSCAAACHALIGSDADVATKRHALAALVRYATPKGVQRPGDLRTPGVAAIDDTASTKGLIHHEHVVPVRLMVDRMLAGDDPTAVLSAAVVAHVLRSEHQQIGPLVTVHAQLYAEMKVADLGDLYALALRRYTDSGLGLATVPHVIDPSNELNSDNE